MKPTILFTAAAALVLSAGCSDDSSEGDEGAGEESADEGAADREPESASGPGDGGHASVAASGAVDGDFEGYATFTQASLDNGSFSLGLTDNSAFGVDLSLMVDDGRVPEPGTYDVIGEFSGFSDEKFSVTFSDFEEGGMIDPDEYGSSGEGSVELVETSQDAVSGHFEVELVEHRGDSEVVLEVKGEFDAAKVAGGDSL